MPTPHNSANLSDIAKNVIMPGDPLRAKYIAENFLEDFKIVNKVRNMFAYTGTYKGKKLTIMASGMGMPSMGIYCYELFKFYEVENIIRIGSCGCYTSGLNIFDIVLANNVYTESNFAMTLNNDDCHIVNSNCDLNKLILETSKDINIDIVFGNSICSECFDAYMTDVQKFIQRFPENFNPITVEMESFSLFYTAKLLNKKASCLMSVVDSPFITNIATSKERESGLNNMIVLALESAIKI